MGISNSPFMKEKSMILNPPVESARCYKLSFCIVYEGGKYRGGKAHPLLSSVHTFDNTSSVHVSPSGREPPLLSF